jgi:hypothetical protein
MHRLYSFDFNFQANILEKDNLFVPSGFDSLKQIEALKKGIIGAVGPDGLPLSFEDVITPPHMSGSSKSAVGKGAPAGN